MNRRGFTLVECLVAMVLTTVIGIMLLKIVMTQARFVGKQRERREAYSVGRMGAKVLLSDLRAVEGSGAFVVPPTAQDITLRVPYAVGILCAVTPLPYKAILLPVDPNVYAQPGHSGFAVRDWRGAYSYVTNSTPPTSSGCGVALVGTLSQPPEVGSAVYLYRNIRYRFAGGALLRGADTLVAPFDPSSRFEFYTDTLTAPVANPPAGKVRGLKITLVGMSSKVPLGSTARTVDTTHVKVFFQNRPD